MKSTWPLVVAVTVLFGAGPLRSQPTPPPVPLSTAQQAALGIQTTPVKVATQQSLLATATVHVPPGHEVVVSAPVSGVVTQVKAGVGDRLRAGMPLASLSSPEWAEARRQAREAEVEYQAAQAAVQREQALYDEGVIPQVRLQAGRNRLQVAQAAWQARQSALKSMGLVGASEYAGGELLTPISGTVIESMVRVGQRLEAGSVLFHVADLRELQLDVVISPEKAGLLKVGDAVEMPAQEARATLIGVGRSVDAGQLVRARAKVTVPGRLTPGQTISVNVRPALPVGSAGWWVPATSVAQWQGRTWVVVVRDQQLWPIAVNVLSSDDAHTIVQGALAPEQRVVSAGLMAVKSLLGKGE